MDVTNPLNDVADDQTFTVVTLGVVGGMPSMALATEVDGDETRQH